MKAVSKFVSVLGLGMLVVTALPAMTPEQFRRSVLWVLRGLALAGVARVALG